MADLGRFAEYGRQVGPTWLAGAIAAGPGTVASVVVGGAQFGYTLLWVVVLSAVLGATAQYLSTRLGLLTERGIVSLVEDALGSGWAWLLVADTVIASVLAQFVIMKTVADVSGILTGVDARVWAVVWGLVLAGGLAGGGYRVAEVGAKLIVSLVVLAFIASLFVVPVDAGAAVRGLVPRIPAGLDGALVAAGILGGGLHVTLVTMQFYTVRARSWTSRDFGLANVDIASSMLGAFGVYSVAIFLVAAAVLHDPSVSGAELTAIGAAQALGPLVGARAEALFLVGLLGAGVSTLGANTMVAPYLLADKLDWERDVADGRYRAAILATALVSVGGVFIGGAFLPLLVLMLALGLVGTPFALALVLYLLNDESVVPVGTGRAANLAGFLVLAAAVVMVGRFLQGHLAGSLDPLTGAILAFAAIFGAATLVVCVRLVWDRLVTDPGPA